MYGGFTSDRHAQWVRRRVDDELRAKREKQYRNAAVPDGGREGLRSASEAKSFHSHDVLVLPAEALYSIAIGSESTSVQHAAVLLSMKSEGRWRDE